MLMAISYMLAGVLPAPSGIGSLEFVFLLFFTRFAKESTAVPAILVFRLMIWIVPFAIGGILSVSYTHLFGSGLSLYKPQIYQYPV